ncbi:CvfB family protein [Lachnoanaerobaculum sp.]
MELGKIQILKVDRKKDFGVYLTDGNGEDVLLPMKEVPKNCEVGSEIEVFIYRDSKDRLIATTRKPKLSVGEIGRLFVKSTTGIGAFLDIGLERDVLLPFKETLDKVKEGDEVLVYLYEDKSHRLAASAKVYSRLSTNSPYKKDDEVVGTVFEIKKMGIFVAVDDKYNGMIPPNENFENVKPGDRLDLRVIRVRDDGKLDLSPRKKAYVQLVKDADILYGIMERRGGSLGFDESVSPDRIKAELELSKNAFKRAVGHLLKEGKIEIVDGDIKIK